MLPMTGRCEADVLAALDRLRADDQAPVPEKTPGRLAAERAYLAMLDVDWMDQSENPSVVALERAVIGAVASKLGGDEHTPGIATSGGTESIILAAKVARDARPEIENPRMVVPVTAHGAFHKAGAYLGIAIDTVAVDSATCRPAPAAIAAALTAETVLIGVSAPSAAHGVIDPVPEIAAIAEERGLACHVDACAGWILPWFEAAGAVISPFDLSVRGVTSISCDLHKIGDIPRALSVLLLRTAAMRRTAYHTCARWSGYTMVTPTVQSSRSAGPLAGAWAGLQVTGEAGYRRLGEQALKSLGAFLEGAADLPELEVLGPPAAPAVSLVARRPALDLFTVCAEARRRGVLMTAQAGLLGLPHSLRVSLTGVAAHEVPALLGALRDAIVAARESPAPEFDAASVASLDVATLDDAAFGQVLFSLGGDVAAINRLLCSLSPAAREASMLRYLAGLSEGSINHQSQDKEVNT